LELIWHLCTHLLMKHQAFDFIQRNLKRWGIFKNIIYKTVMYEYT
jgi:hypothetical protein